MEQITFRLSIKNNPLAIGFMSLLTHEYAQVAKLIKTESLMISDKYPCDICVQEYDIETNPYPNPKVKFTNCTDHRRMSSNHYILPFLVNSQYMPLYKKRKKVQKKYKCVTMYRITKDIRQRIIENAKKICDIVIVNDEILYAKYPEDYNLDASHDYYEIMDKSEFVLCPPGVIHDTYRYSESLYCNSIPLPIRNDDIKYVIPHPTEYSWTEENLGQFKFPEFNEGVLSSLQRIVNEDFMANYVSEIINKHITS